MSLQHGISSDSQKYKIKNILCFHHTTAPFKLNAMKRIFAVVSSLHATLLLHVHDMTRPHSLAPLLVSLNMKLPRFWEASHHLSSQTLWNSLKYCKNAMCRDVVWRHMSANTKHTTTSTVSRQEKLLVNYHILWIASLFLRSFMFACH